MPSVHLIIQTTKGIIRDQHVRRMAMFVIVIAALLMVFFGVTFLNSMLMGTPWLFVLYWGGCAWLTLTAILLAIFDLLAVRMLMRQERRRLRQDILGEKGPSDKE